VRRDSAEFLVKTDQELAKVTWPKVSPWFRPDTQVWGATYVVLIVIAMLTLYVLAADTVLEFLAKQAFFSK
jgi:preprotein translocase SecE subunit